MFTFVISITCFAQNYNVKGFVKDEAGNLLPGANVYLKENPSLGTITDMNGFYELKNLPSGEFTIVAKFIGFKQLEKPVTLSEGQIQTMNFVLIEDTEVLDEVVVVGYGVQSKRDVAGAIVKISSEKLNNVPVQSFEAALQGQAAGIQVVQGSGLSGNGSVVRVRGVSSISSAGDPLYVVDGVPITNDYFLNSNNGAMNNNPLASLNPSDIESVEVLKDAGSAGIYGSRGANGVIIITTKKGKEGKTSFSYNTKVGLSTPAIDPRSWFVSKDDWLMLRQEAWENDGGTGAVWLPNFTSATSSAEERLVAFNKALNDPATDWFNEVLQNGIKHEHNFSGSYGAKMFDVYSGFSYSDNASYLKGNHYEKASVRVNANIRPIKNFTIAVQSSYTQGTNYRVGSAWTGGIGAAMSTALPFYPVYEDDDYFLYSSSANGNNPIYREKETDWKSSEERSINNFSLKYNPIKNLHFTLSYGIDYMKFKNDDNQTPLYSNNEFGNRFLYENKVINQSGNFVVNYILKPDDDNKLTFLAGSEIQQSIGESQNFNTINGILESDDPNTDEWSFVSYFGRANYVFKERYIFQILGRTDASSNFGINNRWGFFPAVSAAWRITQEEWFGIDFVSNLKIRTSYGLTGNANLPTGKWWGGYKYTDYTQGQPGYNNIDILYPDEQPNPDLKWETTRNFDAGLEYGFFDQRIYGEFAFYHKITNDVIMRRSLPLSSGYDYVWDNIGKIMNQGFEFDLHTVNFDGEFKWTTFLNLAYNYNEVLDLGDMTPDAVGGGTNDTRVVEGYPVGTNYLVRYVGVDPTDGLPIWLDADGNETKEFDLDNRVETGSVMPDLIGGFGNNISYKGVDFGFLFNFIIGGNIYDGSGKRQLGVVTDWMMRKEIADRWRQPGDNAQFPRLTLQPSNYPGLPGEWQYNSTLFLYDASFLRLRNVELGYTFNPALLKKVQIKSLRAYVSATNIFTFTTFPLDPEIARDFENQADRNMSTNITYLTPPQERAFIFGLNLKF